ncbi:MAG: hypothetical protein V5A87_06955 [Candidatus Bipolaricaulota bacterium]|nr:hypothetical protein [Candidatus Bipolaricaulota bacterium]MBS3792305.1 hypothetical protein [Candidatus Bipolaricaulota bacterium]
MKTEERRVVEIVVRSQDQANEEEFDGLPVVEVLKPRLIVMSKGEEGEEKEIELPDVRLLGEDGEDDGGLRVHGPDRAKTWKKVSEWIQDIVIDNHPVIQEKRHQNRVKAESSYLYGQEDPELYEWQEDEEILEEMRPQYSSLRNQLVEQIGNPTRSDFAELYPHKYDDPGLSEQARRTVRDLKAVFGSDILIKA